MTSLPGSQRRTRTRIVIAVVTVLVVMATLLTVNLLRNLPSGASPSVTESLVGSATSGPSATPIESPSASSAPSGQKGGTWAATGAMLEARYDIAATLLLDGAVLVAGGALNSEPFVLASAELYDPSTGSWTATAAMIETRYGYTATMLPDGEVLVAGGSSTTGGSSPGPLATAELYDPRNGTWTATGSMSTARTGHTATLLRDGKVLVAGGVAAFGDYVPRSPLASAELYDPGTRTWTAAGSMNEARDGHTATLLTNGIVLVAGGCCNGDVMRVSAELYDPSTNKWTATGNLTDGRSGYTATRLRDGRVLVAGGYGAGWLASAELYDPATGFWTATGNMANPRAGHTATLLPDGKVLVAGGGGEVTFNSDSIAEAELYDPRSGTWTVTGSMSLARRGHTATLLLNGTVLVVGGGSTPASAELYAPSGAP
jgi:galactose oxidase-like protein/Kelch motif protein